MNIGDLDFGYGGDNLFDPGVFKTNLPGQGSKLDYSWFDPNISAGAADTFASSKKSGINWGDVAKGFLDQLDQSRSSGGGGGGYQPSSAFYMMSPSSDRVGNSIYSSDGEEREIGNNIFVKGGKPYFFPKGGTGGSNIFSLGGGIGSAVTNFRPAGSALGISDIAKMGAGFAQGNLTDMALGAVPGIGPALVIANKLHPDGIAGAAKDVSRMAGDIGNTVAKGVGSVVSGGIDFIKGLFDCDERLKVDIAPLESTEVNDELAQMAFFVKGLRECS